MAVVVILLFLKEIFKYTTVNKITSTGLLRLFLGILFIIFSYYTFQYSYGIVAVTSMVLVFSSRDVKMNDILTSFIISMGLVLCITILASKLGIITSYELYDTGRLRQSMGFLYPSHPAHMFFYWVSSYLLLRRNHISYVELFTLFILNILLYRESVTKNPFYLTIFVIIVSLIIKNGSDNKGELNRWYVRFSNLIFVISPLITLWFIYKSPSSLFNYVNNFINGRLVLAFNGINKYGIHWFSQNVQFITRNNMNLFSSYDYIDSGYIQMLVMYGVIFSILVLLLYTYLICKVNKTRDLLLSIILLVVAVYNIFDPTLIYLWYNPFILLCGRFFLENTEHSLIDNNQFN